MSTPEKIAAAVLPDDLSKKVDDLLATRRRDLKLPPDIMALYKERSRASGLKMMAAWCLGVSLVNMATGLLDFPTLGHVRVDFFSRLSVSVMFLLSAPVLRLKLFRNRAQYVIIIACLFLVAISGGLGMFTHDTVGTDRKVSMAIDAVYTAVLFVQIDMPYLIFLGISSICVAAVFLAGCGGNSIHDQLQLLVFYAVTMGSILIARKVQNIYHYQIFLMRTREEIKIRAAVDRGESLSRMAYVDQVTGVPNRRYFDEMCGAMSDSTANLFPVALCMVDIDNFKLLNDSLGHLQGDQCLNVVAATLRDSLRDGSDILARYGGEEFIILLPNTSRRVALEVVERMRVSVFNLGHPNPGAAVKVVTASFGVAVSAAAPLSIEKLIARADAAMYRAKTQGRNRVAS